MIDNNKTTGAINMDKNIEGFEELKSQVEILKNKLSKEEITN